MVQCRCGSHRLELYFHLPALAMFRKFSKSCVVTFLRFWWSVAVVGCSFSALATERPMTFTCSPPASMQDRIKKITIPVKYGSEYSPKKPFDATFVFEEITLHLNGNRSIKLELIEAIAFSASSKHNSEACRKFRFYEVSDSVIFDVTYLGGNRWRPQQVMIARKNLERFIPLQDLQGPFSDLLNFSPMLNSKNCVVLIIDGREEREVGCIVDGNYKAIETTLGFDVGSTSYQSVCDMREQKPQVKELFVVSGHIPDYKAPITERVRNDAQQLCNKRAANNASFKFDF
jgi:hypothetical protein